MNKVLKILGGIFFTIGVVLIGVSIYFKMSFDSFKKTALETNATITSISSKSSSNGDTSYVVMVEFIVDGKTYGGELNYYSSSMRIGEQTPIYYSVENPNNFKSKNGNFLFYIFLLIGVIFLVIGAVMLVSLILKKKKRNQVLSYNYVIQANIVGFNLDTTMSVNGRSPYRLEATYIHPVDGKLYTYRSDELWADLTPILEQRQITTVPVYVNPNNYAEYYVDISNLKNFIGN